MTPPLEGRTVVVIGAGAMGEGWSNGKACAAAYARAGAFVVCADLYLDRAIETAELIQHEGGVAKPMEADVTSEADVRRLVQAALAEFGAVHVLHNNVGVGGAVGTPEDIDGDAWDREIRQNLTSVYLGIRAVAPVMRSAGGGVITNTSSLLSTRFLRVASVAYTASKAGVEALTRSCAAAYGRDNIRVNCLRIGFSETPLMLAGLGRLPADRRDTEMAKSRSKVPLGGRHTDPFEVAAAAVFLASDSASHITGVVLNIDGGLECAPI
jgi:NAD(P)-dependent dehydrogenase (short-subunit alcohol dehydrogenase family)